MRYDDVIGSFVIVQLAVIMPVVALSIYAVIKYPIKIDRRFDGAVVISEAFRTRIGYNQEEYVFEKNSKGKYRLTNHRFEVIAGIAATIIFFSLCAVGLYFVIKSGNGTKESNIFNGLFSLAIIEFAAMNFWTANSLWLRALMAFDRWNNGPLANRKHKKTQKQNDHTKYTKY